jgi:hypothetical protein
VLVVAAGVVVEVCSVLVDGATVEVVVGSLVVVTIGVVVVTTGKVVLSDFVDVSRVVVTSEIKLCIDRSSTNADKSSLSWEA